MKTAGRIFARLLLALLGGCTVLAARANGDARFSSTLTVTERDRAGLTRLSPDNLAVLDGLVRQDDAASKFKDNDVDGTRFSRRHTPHERELAGLDRLTPAQLGALDDSIGQRYVTTPPVANFTATAFSSPHPVGVKPNVSTNKLDIHGEISYTQGWSKGGSFSGGDIMLTYVDPEGRYAVAVGYGEYRGRGTMAPCFFSGYGPYHSYWDPFPTFR